MSSSECPAFLKPRLRLYLSADIIGSTALKQSRLGALGRANPSSDASWFTIIQGFYFEAQQILRRSWTDLETKLNTPDAFGEPPTLWKTVGDEVLFTKLLTDHRQLATTLNCWLTTLAGIRRFLNRDSARLGIKSTVWIAGFPFRNKEVVLSGKAFSSTEPIDDYYRENGLILDEYYKNPSKDPDINIDYVGPSIDTGFRLTTLATSRKLIVSLDAAYILARSNRRFVKKLLPDGLHYDGQVFLKGVLGGTNYPVFWLDLSDPNSSAAREDKLTNRRISDWGSIEDFCDAFYEEQRELIFPPFIDGSTETLMSDRPEWYDERHNALVKNFNDSYESSLVTPEPETQTPIGEDAFKQTAKLLEQRTNEILRQIEEARRKRS